MDIKTIVGGCVQNDPICQKMLFNMFYHKMLNISLRYASDEHQAKDIVQLSFIKVFEKISQYSLNNSLEAWISKIVTHTAIDEKRKDKFKDNTVNIDIVSLKTDEQKYNETFLNYILSAVDKLPHTYKTVFKLHVIQEYPHKKIAEMLNICEGTSKSNLFKAKSKLRDLLKDKFKEEYY